MPELTPEEIDHLVKITQQYEEVIRYMHCGSLPEKIEALLRRSEQQVSEALASMRQFNEDTLIWVHALVIVADSAANAGTHTEKNARLRGLVGILESTAEKLREQQFTFDSSYHRWPNLYHSDYPVRRYMDRAESAELQMKLMDGDLDLILRRLGMVDAARESLPEEVRQPLEDAIQAILTAKKRKSEIPF